MMNVRLLITQIALCHLAILLIAGQQLHAQPRYPDDAVGIGTSSPQAGSYPATNFSSKAINALHQSVTNVSGLNSTNNASAGPGKEKAGLIDNMDVLDNHYVLTIGDRVSFRILEDEDPASELTVTDSGDLEIPYVGLYAATGKTCKELARVLKTELEAQYYYKATVIIALVHWAKSQGKIYIVGPVRLPGPQEIPSDEALTLSKAILRAGGFSDYADQRKIRVTRKPAVSGGKDQEFTIDVEEVLKKGDRSADLMLQDGDLIFVPERIIHF